MKLFIYIICKISSLLLINSLRGITPPDGVIPSKRRHFTRNITPCIKSHMALRTHELFFMGKS